MPNWCNNVVTIEHKNKTAIDRVVKAYNNGKLCNEFIPTPEELENTSSPNRTNAKEMKEKYGHEDWYEFHLSQWGTKWDVGKDEYGEEAERVSPKKVELTFDSAWSPPVGLYEKLSSEGYHVTAYYYEPGAAFVGVYRSEVGDECYTIPDRSEDVMNEIPEELDEMFNISGSMKLNEDELENLMGG